MNSLEVFVDGGDARACLDSSPEPACCKVGGGEIGGMAAAKTRLGLGLVACGADVEKGTTSLEIFAGGELSEAAAADFDELDEMGSCGGGVFDLGLGFSGGGAATRTSMGGYK